MDHSKIGNNEVEKSSFGKEILDRVGQKLQ